MSSNSALRAQVSRLLDWHDAHADFESAVADLPVALRGRVPPGLPYSPWQLLEHMRLAQSDILEFCESAGYAEKRWPDDYWPTEPAPPHDSAWDESIAGFLRDRLALQRMATDEDCDLFAKVPAGDGQTFLREFLLVADHNAYHIGQLVVARRLLSSWPDA
jgi:hypothetical protein